MYGVTKTHIWFKKLRRRSKKKAAGRTDAHSNSPDHPTDQRSISLPTAAQNQSATSIASFDRDVTKLDQTRKWLDDVDASPDGKSGSKPPPPYTQPDGPLVIDDEGRTRQLTAGEEAEREDNLRAAVLSRMSGIPSKAQFRWSKAQPMGYVVDDSDGEGDKAIETAGQDNGSDDKATAANV